MVAAVLLAALGATASGCAYIGMMRQRRELRTEFQDSPRLAVLRMLAPENCLRVEGRLTGANSGTALLIAALSSQYVSNELVTWRSAMPGSAHYSLVLPPGAYRLVAFADMDRDGHFDRDELVGATPRGGDVIVDVSRAADGFTVPGPPIAVHLAHPSDAGFDMSVAASGLSYVVPSLDEELFDPRYGEMGLYRPAEFLDRVQGLAFSLEPFDPTKTAVLFVHGMLGTPRDFAYLVSGLDRLRFQPWFFYYPTGMPLDKEGAALGSLMGVLQRNGSRRMVLVVHSMGGLVARAALNHVSPGGQAPSYLRGCFSFAATYGGSDAARARMAPVKVASWQDLATGSRFIEALHGTPFPEGLPFYLFFAWGKDGVHGPEGAGDGTISLRSQLDPRIQPHATRMFGYAQTHVGILNDGQVRRTFLSLLSRAAR